MSIKGIITSGLGSIGDLLTYGYHGAGEAPPEVESVPVCFSSTIRSKFPMESSVQSTHSMTSSAKSTFPMTSEVLPCEGG